MSAAAGWESAGTGDSRSPGSSMVTRWRRVEELFHRARECPEAERERMVREAAGPDVAMVDEVMELLAADSSIEHRMRERRVGSDGSSGARGMERELEEEAAEALVGASMGKYRLQRVLGRGGMGVVYLAQAGSAGPVAVKVVRHLLRSSPALQQFLLERDTLARLEHPNIARLLDGGVTPDAMPYVVMDYVAGRRLDVYCDQPEVSAEDVVRLMLQLCDAVAYVHRNLILHRDLKPGNVMVTDAGLVKLLDFGTLKSMGPAAADSALTRAGMRPVTLRYASPEHIRGDAVSTASEVYSLGVVLYRLLSGQTPFSKGDLPTADFLLRLRDGQVKPPSQAARGEAIKPMSRELARDLDALVLKSMRYEPGDRYPTVDALADDLRRALSGMPVEARGGAPVYRARKFYRRNRGSVWAAAAAVVVLTVGTAAMAREGQIARAEQQRADQGVERERQLAHLLLFDYFTQLQQIAGSTDAQRQAVASALSFLDELSASAPGDAVRLESVRAYTAMGQLQGSPYYQNLGDAPGGLVTLNKALPMAEALARNNPGSLDDQNGLIGVQMVLGQVLMGLSKPKQALGYLQAAAKSSREVAERPGASLASMVLASRVQGLLCDDYTYKGAGMLVDNAKGTEAGQAMVALNERAARAYPPCPPCQHGKVIALTKLGSIQDAIDTKRAYEYYDQALALLRAMAADQQGRVPIQRSYGIVRTRMIALEIYAGRNPDALIAEERSNELKAIAADPFDVRARYDLAGLDSSMMDAYNSVGNKQKTLAEAVRFLESTTILVKLRPKNQTYQYLQSTALLQHGRALSRSGQEAAGQREMDAGMVVLLPLAQDPDAEPDTLGMASEFLIQMHRNPARDGPLAVEFMRRSIGNADAPTSDQLLELSQAQKLAGQTTDSRDSARRALALLESNPRGGFGHDKDVALARGLVGQPEQTKR